MKQYSHTCAGDLWNHKGESSNFLNIAVFTLKTTAQYLRTNSEMRFQTNFFLVLNQRERAINLPGQFRGMMLSHNNSAVLILPLTFAHPMSRFSAWGKLILCQDIQTGWRPWVSIKPCGPSFAPPNLSASVPAVQAVVSRLPVQQMKTAVSLGSS